MSTNITEHVHYEAVVNQTLDRWRSIRELVFRKVDEDRRFAESINDTEELAKIEDLCQQLRDVTQFDFSTFETLEEIQTYTPPVLSLYKHGIWKPY